MTQGERKTQAVSQLARNSNMNFGTSSNYSNNVGTANDYSRGQIAGGPGSADRPVDYHSNPVPSDGGDLMVVQMSNQNYSSHLN